MTDPTAALSPPLAALLPQALLPQALREQALPVLLIVGVTLLFMLLERIRPGRALPPVRGWYLRAAAMNAMQIALVGAGGLLWNRYFRAHSLGPFVHWDSPVLEGFVYWLLGTFVFYWWHRLRHASGFWQVFHQIHHSPSRIEVLTSFYKHPLEIAADSLLASALIYGLLGGSALAGAWTSFFGAAGEYFYHSNIRTPPWLVHPAPRAPLHPPPARRAPPQLRRPHRLGSALRHLPGQPQLRRPLRLPRHGRRAARSHAGLSRRVRRPA
jgi:sterol desaturase/sphingolipid hydroxylase (fatty acid hydroxylase superfamily)